MRALRSRQIFQDAAALVQPGQTTFGSQRPSQFFRDLANGVDSLDIVVVGDSNTGSALADMWGYHHGLQQALYTRGYTMYATPVLPVMTGLTSGVAISSPNTWRSETNLVSGTFTNSPLLDGNVSGGSTPYAAWTPSVTWTRYGSSSSSPPYKESWAYIESTTEPSYFSSSGLSILVSHPLNASGQTIVYRVRYGRFSSNGGQFTPLVLRIGTAITEASARTLVSTSGGNGLVDSTVVERTFAPDGAVPYRGAWSYNGPGGEKVRGPVAIHSHSMYRAVKGFAVTSHGYQGGETSTQIATKINAIKNGVLTEHLKELRERQISAGGSGRVLVMVQSGINGADTASTWTAAHQTIWAAYRAAWASLGYPTTDLAIVSWVGHVLNATDTSDTGASGNMGACRVAAQQMAANSPDHCVVDVKRLMTYEQMLWAGGNGTTFYQRYNNLPAAGANITAHMSGGWYTGTTYGSSDGYTTMSNLIVSALLGTA